MSIIVNVLIFAFHNIYKIFSPGPLRLPGPAEPGAGSPHGGPQGDNPQGDTHYTCVIVNNILLSRCTTRGSGSTS